MAVWSLPVEAVGAVVNAAAHMTKGVVKSLRIGHVVWDVTEMPFANVCRFVSLGLEVFRDGYLFAGHPGSALDGCSVAGNAGAQRVAAGQQPGP